ncbi:MAG: glycosyltransferase family 4 protein, partial [Candidatus Peribacteraceae bacterium]|nr:glycosyltransferase family 4 protein [Candidatus Peribacteraceae bacterium]
MRILFTRFPLESARGGAEVQTLSLMKGLNERGHAVAFLGSCPVLLEETAKLHLPHAKLKIGPPPVTKWGAMNFFWRKHKMQQRLEAALSGFSDLDAIFMLSMSEKLLLTEAAVAKGIKVFWIEHDRVGRWLTKNPWLPRLRELSNTVTTICVSELSRKIYLDLGWKPEKVIAIPNGIDLKRFSSPPSPRTAERGAGGVRLGCVARLSPGKGVDVLIQAVSGLPEVDLTIIGKGPDEG